MSMMHGNSKMQPGEPPPLPPVRRGHTCVPGPHIHDEAHRDDDRGYLKGGARRGAHQAKAEAGSVQKWLMQPQQQK